VEWRGSEPGAAPFQAGPAGRRRSLGTIFSIDVAEQLHQSGKRRLIYAPSELLDAVAGRIPKLVNGPFRFRQSDHRDVQGSVPHHVVQRREDLLVGEISGRAKKTKASDSELARG